MADYLCAMFGAAIGATVLSRGWQLRGFFWAGRAVTREQQPGPYWSVMALAGVLVAHGVWYLSAGWG
ncbi:MAG: hypothetical protein ACAH11_11085 [Sphingomonas sp.]